MLYSIVVFILFLLMGGISTVQAENFFDTLKNPVNTGSTASQIEHFSGQYTEIHTLLEEHPLEKNTKAQLQQEKIRIDKKIRSLIKTYRKENGIIQAGGFDITSKLKIKDIQSYALSCESSATATIISYLTGAVVTEDAVISKLTPHYFGKSKNKYGVWGDPDIGFVGDIHGNQRKLTGFGVYEKPLQKIYSQYGLSTKILNNTLYDADMTAMKHLRFLLDALEAGDGIQVWGDYCTSKDAEDGILDETSQILSDTFGLNSKNTCSSESSLRQIEWKIYNEKLDTSTITGLIGEHNFVLLGWKGDKTNPTHIIVWDTFTGKHIYPINEWLKKWSAVNNRSIVVSKK